MPRAATRRDHAFPASPLGATQQNSYSAALQVRHLPFTAIKSKLPRPPDEHSQLLLNGNECSATQNHDPTLLSLRFPKKPKVFRTLFHACFTRT